MPWVSRTGGVVVVGGLVPGESLIDPAVTGRLLERLRNPPPAQDPRLSTLTKLEKIILDHVAEGLTKRQIAASVNLAEKAVNNYVLSILMKLEMSRRTEAAVHVVRSGEHDADHHR